MRQQVQDLVDATARLSRLNGVTAAALWVVNAIVLSPRAEEIAAALVACGVGAAFNALVNLYFVPRAGVGISELVRTITNITAATLLARHTGWPATAWLWVPFSTISVPDRSFRLHVAQLVAWTLVLGAFAIADGVHPVVPLGTFVLSAYVVAMAKLAFDLNDAVRHRHERKLASIIEHIGDGICSVDRELRVIAVNGAFNDYIRWRRGDELAPGDALFRPDLDDISRGWRERFERALRDETVASGEHSYTRGDETRFYDATVHPIRARGKVTGATVVLRNVTARRALDERAEALQRQLLEISRKAGMAEVASSVLHNIGNVLNSVNVSASVLGDRVRELGGGTVLARLGELLHAHAADLPGFFASDPRARRIPELVGKLAEASETDRQFIAGELDALRRNLEHIKAIVTVQQSQARAGGVVENVDLAAVIDDAITIGAASDARYGVELVRAYDPLPPVQADRHKLLQILMNLLANARHAVRHGARAERRIAVRLALAGCGDEVSIDVEDNGYGIAPENLPRIFTHGFTTKPDGHGFGLHSSAAAATEMGGSLSVESELGQGARFTLRLPLRAVAAAAAA